MKLATLSCLAALCLFGSFAHAAPGEPAPAEQPRREQGTAPQKPAAAKPEPGKAEAPTAKVEVGRSAGAPLVGRDKRRRSYAACNRASHQRGYRGGKRRRFLIRCRLGYERTRVQQHQAPSTPSTPSPATTAPAAPAPAPVRKP